MSVTPEEKQPDVVLGLVVTAEAEVIKADAVVEPTAEEDEE